MCRWAMQTSEGAVQNFQKQTIQKTALALLPPLRAAPVKRSDTSKATDQLNKVVTAKQSARLQKQQQQKQVRT